ncbi:MAG: TOBE domain-containing protein, partial [Acidimicrobiales bacterium]
AMTMGDRIAVMSAGVLQQVAAPQEIYERPSNVFVAAFIGSPGMNLLRGTFDPTIGERVVRVETGTVPVPARFAVNRAAEVVVGCRPEALTLDPEGTLSATVSIVELLGAEVHVVCKVGDARLVVRQEITRARPNLGEQVTLRVDPDGVHVFDGGTGDRLASSES